MKRRVIIGLLAMGFILTNIAEATNQVPLKPSDYSSMQSTIETIKLPPIPQPEWLKHQIEDEKRAASTITVTYDVTTNGLITADFANFKLLANQTLNDSRGWTRLNARFVEVASGGQFTLVLAEAGQVPTYSPNGCSAEYSCNVGRYVIINQTRWESATPSWNQAGGSLRDYRHMVVNHETGHWLGHPHEFCAGAGQPAPVMQQQSISLQGCSFNPWPLPKEIWSTRLGVV